MTNNSKHEDLYSIIKSLYQGKIQNARLERAITLLSMGYVLSGTLDLAQEPRDVYDFLISGNHMLHSGDTRKARRYFKKVNEMDRRIAHDYSLDLILENGNLPKVRKHISNFIPNLNKLKAEYGTLPKIVAVTTS